MSSWLYSVASRWTGAMEEQHEQNPGPSEQPNTVESPTEAISRALDELSQQQKETIQEVLRRAEQSRKNVRVVMDARRLGMLRERTFSVEDTDEPFCHNGKDEHQLVQMDSIPEDIIVSTTLSEEVEAVEESHPTEKVMPRRQSSTLSNRMKLISTHIAHWFNTLDYDGDYMATGMRAGKVPYEEMLGSLVLHYIDALSSGILIAACIEYSAEELRRSPQFQRYCQDLCESIFDLAYSQIEIGILEDTTIKQIDEYCADLSHHVLQTVFFALIEKSVQSDRTSMLSTLTMKHKKQSFNSASDLEDYLERISEEDENEVSSIASEEEDYGYELLGAGQRCSSQADESVSQTSPRSLSDEDESSAESIISVIARKPSTVPSVQIVIRPPTPPKRPPPPTVTIIVQEAPPVEDEELGSDASEEAREEQYVTARAAHAKEQKPVIRQRLDDDADDLDLYLSQLVGDWIIQKPKAVEQKTEPIIIEELSHAEEILKAHPVPQVEEQLLTQEELDHIAWIQQLAAQSSFEKPSRPAPPTFAEEEEDHSSATSGADERELSEQSSFEQQPSLDLVPDYGKSSPLLEPTAEEEEPIVAEEQPLTQEELDHIAWIQQLAAQSSFEKPSRPAPPTFAEEEEDHSSATSGADERELSEQSSFEQQPSLDLVPDYGKSSPLLEPTAEEEDPIVAEEQLLTQEELDHIAWIQQLAAQSSFEKPSRPAPPTFAEEEEEDHSSATSGADERELTEQSSFEQQPSLDLVPDYGKSSPLLEPTAEEEEPIVAEEQLLTQEELDHIAWIQQLAAQSSFEKPSRPAPPTFAEEEEDHSSATSGADERELSEQSSFEQQPSFDILPDYGKSSPLLEPTAEEEEPIVGEEQLLTQEELDHIAWIQQLAAQSSFEKPSRPAPPTFAEEEEEDHSSATSGADERELTEQSSFEQQPSLDLVPDYGKSSPLLEPTAEEEEPIVAEEQPLTQEELDHIAWIQQLAAQSSFEKPSRPAPPTFAEEEEDHSSATSGADERELSEQSSFEQQPSLDLVPDYGKSSPLLEPTAEEEEPIVAEEQLLTQEELDHIAWIQQLAAQSSFEKPSRPAPPTFAEEEEEDHSSATSGADERELTEQSSFEQQPSLDLVPDYGKSSPLLEPTAEEEEPIVAEEQPLTQEELDHIAWIQQLAAQSSFEKPSRPAPPTFAEEEEEDHSSATSGADERELTEQSSFEQQPSLDLVPDYGKSSPLLEPTAEEEEPIVAEEQLLTQEELDHIAWIQQLAAQSSFEKPSRPAPPTFAEEEEDHSSATSGADERELSEQSSFEQQPSFDILPDYGKSSPLLEPTAEEEEPIVAEEQLLTQEELDHIAWIQQLAAQSSFEKPSRPAPPTFAEEEEEDHSSATSGADERELTEQSSFEQQPSLDLVPDYGKSSPLLEPTAEEEEPIVAEEQPLTQEELDHIAWIQQLAAQSSFEKPSRPAPPTFAEEEEDHSSATSGADERELSEQSSFEQQPSLDLVPDYGKSSPLLEPTAEEEEPIVAEEQLLTQEELDHIAWIQQLAAQSSFEKPSRPAPPTFAEEEEEDHSSATSGADERELTEQSSFEQQPSLDLVPDYGKSSPLLEPTAEEEEPIVAEEQLLTQEELDHIAWIQQLAAQSSFEKPSRPAPPTFAEEEEEDHSSATSGADERELTEQSSFEQQPSLDLVPDYGKSSPLLEPTAEEEEPIVAEEQLLTQEELDHIAWIQQLAAQSSFEKPSRPAPPTFAEEEEDHSSATSGAAERELSEQSSFEQQPSLDLVPDYGKSSPLLEPTAEEEEPIVAEEQPLTQEELDHIAWIQQLAAQSSFEKPSRPAPPTFAEEEEDHSSATSGADERELSEQSSFEQQPSLDLVPDYGKSSPLLEPTAEEEEPIVAEEQPLTQEELDHIAWIQQLAAQSSFEKPSRPAPPTFAEEEEEDHSSATSGADERELTEQSSFEQQPSLDLVPDYGKSSPLLEPTAEEEEPIVAEEQPLTQEELDHIAWIQQLAAQSSFEKPSRPAPPTFAEEEEDHSSATSGADERELSEQSSFEQQPSFDILPDYGKSSPLLEPTAEEEEPIVAEEQPLTQEELDHIAWIQQLAAQSSFEKPSRPAPPTFAEEEEDHSSATSGADERELSEQSSFEQQPSFDILPDYGKSSPLLEPTAEEEEPIVAEEQPLTQEELDHIAWIQQLAAQSSFEKPSRPAPPTFAEEEEDHSSATSGADERELSEQSSFEQQPSFDILPDYGKSSPLLEPTAEEEEPIVAEEQPLTQEELDHIAWIQQLAAQSSFEKPSRPAPPTFAEEEEDHSTATSGADERELSEQSSFEQQPSLDLVPDYGKSSPLLEPTAEEEEPIVAEEQPLTQEELDHIAWIQQLAAQSSFEKPSRPAPPTFAEEEEDHSTATSGADERELSEQSSFEQQPSLDLVPDYGKSSPLLEPTAEEEEPIVAEEQPLTQEELDHIAWIQQLAAQSSFEKPSRPAPPTFAEEEEDHSSATSGADERELTEQSSFEQQPSLDLLPDYGKSSPLLEPTAEEEEPIVAEEQPLTQEELDHIAWIQQLAAQSSFEKPSRPAPPTFAEEEEDHSSATSGADERELSEQSSFEQQPSLDLVPDYGKSSPLLEPTAEEEDPIVAEEQLLTQEELDHIAWIQQLAAQSSFEKPSRPAPPTFAEEEEDHSSATSGADERELTEQSSFEQQPSLDLVPDYGKSSPLLEPTAEEEEPIVAEELSHAEEILKAHPVTQVEEQPLTQEELDHIAWIQQLAAQSSFEKPSRPAPPTFAEEEEDHSSATSGADERELSEQSSFEQQPSLDLVPDYGKSSPLLEPTAEEEEPIVAEEQPLTQEELDHIAWIQQLAAQSSFEKPSRPAPPTFAEEEEDHSSATSGADERELSEQSSFEQQPSLDLVPDYGKSSPLLEPTAEEEEPIVAEEQPLTQEELDHIAWIQQLAAQSSFEKPSRPAPPTFAEEEEDHSSATSGADERELSKQSSFEQQPSLDLVPDYGKSSPLLEPTAEEEEPIVAEEQPLTQEELDHIAWIQQLAAQSSFEKLSRPAPPTFAEEEEDHSSATSGADERELTEQSSFEQQPSLDLVPDYGKSSPLLEPTAEEEEPIVAEEQPLTQEELDHIAWIQQLAAQSSFEKPSRPAPPTFAEEEEDHSSATSGADERELTEQSSFEQQPSLDLLPDYGKSSPLLEPTAEEEEPILAEELSHAEGNKAIEVASYANIFPESSMLQDELVTMISYSQHTSTVSESCGYIAHPVTVISTVDSVTASPQPLEPRSPSYLHRSFSDIRIDVPVDIPRDLKLSLSTSCVSEKCGELHLKLNAFELCEQHSFTQSRDLLCNVDFLCRLNFVANRMTEDIAEHAGKELLQYYQSQYNPRARYFGNHMFPDRSVSEDSETESNRRASEDFSVEPDIHVPSSGGFLSLFSKKSTVERPRSSLSIFYTERTRKISEQPLGRKRSDGADILNLLRRSSGVESRASTESPMRLPDHALVGLSDEEKEHIMGVLQRSTKSQSPSMSRRPSSVLQVLPEMDNITDAERDHIQSVLDRANSPYILRKKTVGLLENAVEEEKTEEAWMEAEAAARVELHRQKQETPILTAHSAVIQEDIASTKVAEISQQNAAILVEERKTSVSSRKSSTNNATSPNPTGQFLSFFGKAKESVKSVTSTIVRAVPDRIGLEEAETLSRMSRLAEQSVVSVAHQEQHVGKPAELSNEELEHIRRVQEMAEMDTRTSSRRITPVEPIPPVSVCQTELTQEELEHIQRVQEMADVDFQQTTVAREKEVCLSPTLGISAEEMEHIQRIEQLAQQEVGSVKGTESLKTTTSDVPTLSAEELEHIRRIQDMAALDAHETHFRTSLPVQQKEQAVSPRLSEELTKEELEHIRRIQEMAEMELEKQTPRQPELSAEELDHIRRVQEMASLDADLSFPVGMGTKTTAYVEPELTAEEMDHIRRIEEMAEREASFVPSSARSTAIPAPEELTAEEIEHIRKVQEMAELETPLVNPMKAVLPESAIQHYELSEEELAHIRRIEEMANMETVYPETERIPTTAPEHLQQMETLSIFDTEEVKETTDRLTAEELEHIQRVVAMAEFDNFGRREPDVLTEEELEHIARIAAMAEEELTPLAQRPEDGEPVEQDLERRYREMERRSSYEAHYPSDIFEEGEEADEYGAYSPDRRENPFLSDQNYGSYELTEEEMEHIRRVTQLAERASIYAEQGIELSSDDLNKFALERKSLREEVQFDQKWMERGASLVYESEGPFEEFDESLTKEEMEHIRRISERDEEPAAAEELPTYDIPEPDYDQRDGDITFYPESQEPCESERDTSEELDSRILDRSSPAAKDGSFGCAEGINYGADAHPTHELSSQVEDDEEMSFDIRQVREMPRDQQLGQWYETQLSFMRDSIEQEEELERSGSREPIAPADAEPAISEARLERRPSDSLHIAAHPPKQLTPYVTPLTEQASGPLASPTPSKPLPSTGWPSRIDRPSSSMFTAAKPGRFGFSGLGKFAQDAFDKAKKAGEQLQAAAEPPRHHAAVENEEERLKREAAEACARLDAISPLPPVQQPSTSFASLLPPGIEDLPIEEQQKILAVLAEAESQAVSPLPSRPSVTPTHVAPSAVPTRTQGPSSATVPQPTSISPRPQAGLGELSLKEQERIMAVIAQAEAMDAAISQPPKRVEPRAQQARPAVASQMGPEVPPGLEELSQEERDRILAVIASAEMTMGEVPVPQSTAPVEAPAPVWQVDRKRESDSRRDTETISESYPSPERSEWMEPSTSTEFEYQQPVSEPSDWVAPLPRTPQLPFAPATETCIDADLSPLPEEEPVQPMPSRDRQQTSMASSSESPVRESGYGSASTSYATELGDYAFKPSGLLDETMDQREGARSRNGSRAEDVVDDDFTYSDQRFSELHDDNLFEVTQYDAKEATVDAVEVSQPNWSQRGRMWTTVFEGEEHPREAPAVSASPTDAIEMDNIYDNIFSGSQSFKEIEFDSTPKPVQPAAEAITLVKVPPKAVEEKVLPPEIMVTIHQDILDRRSDSEEEESGSEDDDEYPDRVVAAPVAAPPSFEEVEQERLQQEQFGKEVLQQIQAFGESADDEFDVQWARTALEGNKPDLVTSTTQSLDLSSQLNRKNPFLDSPEEEDVSVDMEDLDLQRIYHGHPHIGATHRPVYTIPEDENEPRGTAINSDSKLYAKEKRRMAARSVADRIIQLSSTTTTSVPTAVVYTPSKVVTSTVTEVKATHPSLFTSSYLFSTAPFVLPTSSAPLYATASIPPASIVRSEQQKKDAELNKKIDKTLSDIHDLLDSCAVYTSEKGKPNLLCYSGTAFQTPTSTSFALGPPEECTSCSPSPSFLIPLSATLNREKQQQDQVQTGTLGSGLRRSPGMMLPAEGGGEAPPVVDIFGKERALVTPLKEVLEDDVPAAVQDMGRRKLPSIPSQPGYSTTTTYPAPPPGAYVVPPSSEPQRIMARVPPAQQTFLSSSAPSSTAGTLPLFGPSTGTQTNGLPNGPLPSERPSSALSWTSVASTSKTRDPAIIPGASFHPKPKIAVRQPVSSIIGRRSSGAKVPNTLARVLLKKELKEALSRRKETLEACEIEANQRQYVVHRMLVTGLLPEGREDDTPNVIPCLLPIELINGARVIPKKTCTVATQKSEEDTRPLLQDFQPPKPPLHARSSIGVQIEEPLLDRSRGYSIPSTSLSQQLRPLSSYKRTAETQTDATNLPFFRETPLDRERVTRSTRHDATAQTTDLLEATRKYFEDYDRKLRELGVRTKKHHHKHHFHFHDDEDSLSREQRKSELSEELARRRERLWTSNLYDTAGDSYRYGSLPRIDRASTTARDFTARDPVYNPAPYSYASLPRNYERMMAPAPLEPIQIEYEQSFGGRPSYQTGYGMGQPMQTRSLLNLSADYPPYSTFPTVQPDPLAYRGRSLNYLDQVDAPRTLYPETYQDPSRYHPSFHTYQSGRPYSQDTTNLTRSGANDLLSQYATYLQREYQPTLLSAEPRAAVPLRRPYDPPLSDPYRFSEPPRLDPYLPDDRGYGTLPTAMPSLGSRYEAPLSDPYYATPSEFAVYSRSENNYGARPAAYSMDYGNLQRNGPVYPPTRTDREDALSRVYASRRRVAEKPQTQSSYRFRSLGKVNIQQPSPPVVSPRSNNTKRLLLTRCYKDHNIYNDLGVRVVGGKRMRDGTLGAFVSAVNQGKYSQTLGEIRPGDQVLEWNGIFLSGKTFEEVERIVNSSSGEVEIVVRTGEPEYSQTGEFDIRTASPERKPPVPMHRKQNTRIYDSVETTRTRKTTDSNLGHIQVATFYDQRLCKLIVRIMSARGLKMRDSVTRAMPNPFVKVYLLPGRKVSHKRRTRFVPCNVNPEWNQSVEYEVPSTALYAHCLELTIWDYDKYENNALGRVVIPLSDPTALSGVPRWYTIEVLDPRTARTVLNAPLERNMTSTQNYVPAALDIGYPAID